VGLAEERTHLENDFVLIVKSTDLDKSRYALWSENSVTVCGKATCIWRD